MRMCTLPEWLTGSRSDPQWRADCYKSPEMDSRHDREWMITRHGLHTSPSILSGDTKIKRLLHDNREHLVNFVALGVAHPVKPGRWWAIITHTGEKPVYGAGKAVAGSIPAALKSEMDMV